MNFLVLAALEFSFPRRLWAVQCIFFDFASIFGEFWLHFGLPWRKFHQFWQCVLLCVCVCVSCVWDVLYFVGLLGCCVVGFLGSWILELLGCFVSGLLGCWVVWLSVGCWVVGVLGCWVVGLVGRWVGGLLSWIVGLLVCWFVALLVCWSVAIFKNDENGMRLETFGKQKNQAYRQDASASP